MRRIKILLFILPFLLTLGIQANAQENLVSLSAKLEQVYNTEDTLFSKPFIDIDEWRDQPVRHRYVHGGFKGTETRFSFYFPSGEQYEGRFFQYITPFPDNENISQRGKGEEDKIGFSIASGAYFIETNGGGAIDFSNPRAGDPTIGAYRANAASAEFSRVVASELFGEHRAFGYCFGGSGGAFRTVGGFENTDGVWDGAVPYVMGSPVAIPNVFSVRMHAMRILKNKMPQIIDALEPGGSGDMYAGLNEEERRALEEVTKMGFPPKSWFGYETMGVHGFLVLYQSIVGIDNQYFSEDFWNKPGYLGANPTQSLLNARVQKSSKIKRAIGIDEAVKLGLAEPLSATERGTADAAWKSMGGEEGALPVAFELEDEMPAVDFLGGDMILKTGDGLGKTLQLTGLKGKYVTLGPVSQSLLIQVKSGDEVQVDNSNFLAVQTYHRHQVPGPEYHVWDQFRDDQGNPIYPQRFMQLGPLFTMGAAGSLPTGKFHGKMIVVDCLFDREAFPWQGDWYLNVVKNNLGEDFDQNLRLWYVDRALHGDLTIQEDPTRTVSYLGVLQQALRDLSQWVEKGIEPASTTGYEIKDGQVIVPQSALERKGIQAIVHATVDGQKKVEISSGGKVALFASVDIPENMGELVYAAWDLDGSGEYKNQVDLRLVKINEETGKREFTIQSSFDKSGTYFPTIRIATQRKGDSETPFARIQNLDRVRVVVKE